MQIDFESIIDQVTDLIYIRDLDMNIIYMNPAAEKMSGWTLEEAKTKKCYEVFGNETLSCGQSCPAEKMMKENLPFLHYNGKCKSESDIREMKITYSPYYNQDQLIGCIVVMHDITQLKAIEKTHQETVAQLENLLKEKQDIEDQISQHNKKLENLLYIVSHDVKEPIRNIKNYSRILLKRYAEQLDEKGQKFLERNVIVANRATNLLNDLTSLLCIQTEHDERKFFDIRKIIKIAIKELDDMMMSRQAQIHISDQLPPKMYVNKAWIERAIVNLLSNAIKYTSIKDIPDIQIELYHPQEDEKGDIGLAFMDRGIGIEPTHSEKVFKFFKRGQNHQVEGTGAGLAIVKEIAHYHGGEVWVKPRDGGGSIFIFTLSQTQIEP